MNTCVKKMLIGRRHRSDSIRSAERSLGIWFRPGLNRRRWMMHYHFVLSLFVNIGVSKKRMCGTRACRHVCWEKRQTPQELKAHNKCDQKKIARGINKLRFELLILQHWGFFHEVIFLEALYAIHCFCFF